MLDFIRNVASCDGNDIEWTNNLKISVPRSLCRQIFGSLRLKPCQSCVQTVHISTTYPGTERKLTISKQHCIVRFFSRSLIKK